ncbi:hypothetical protein J27TS7_52350 [Paenibacillus dendritiformis]|nr:hypothetical protein J27TS7_52350 [Paenibacillus dendritiformis]
MKRKLAKIWKISILALALLIAAGLIFPTWTPCIDGKNSISTLEQVEINGAGHEVMIRGTDRRNPIVIFVHGGQGVPKFLMWASIKKPSKRILRSYTMINAAAGNTKDAEKLELARGLIEKGEAITPRNLVRKYGGAARLIDHNMDYYTGSSSVPSITCLM